MGVAAGGERSDRPPPSSWAPWLATWVVLAVLAYGVLSAQRDESLLRETRIWLLEMESERYDVVCALVLAAALGVLFAPPLLRHVRPRPETPADAPRP